MEYKAIKAIQVLARIAANHSYHPVPIAKLSNLVFLSDLESIKRHGYPILDEPRVATHFGPVNLFTCEILRGERTVPEGRWARAIEPRGEHTVSIDRSITTDDLDELSIADIKCIDAACHEFKNLDPRGNSRGRTQTATNIPAWNYEARENQPIHLLEMMKAAGHTDDDADHYLKAYEEQGLIEAAFERARLA